MKKYRLYAARTESKSELLTNNGRVIYMALYVMILMRANPLLGPL